MQKSTWHYSSVPSRPLSSSVVPDNDMCTRNPIQQNQVDKSLPSAELVTCSTISMYFQDFWFLTRTYWNQSQRNVLPRYQGVWIWNPDKKFIQWIELMKSFFLLIKVHNFNFTIFLMWIIPWTKRWESNSFLGRLRIIFNWN